MRRLTTLLLAAAAAVLALPTGTASAAPPSGPVTTAPLATWFSGVLQPGQIQTGWNWKAGENAVYEVAFDPVGATAAAPCQFESTRQWYAQEPGGNRYFHWTVKNVGTVACGADVILTYRLKTASFALAGITPGSTAHRTWNIDDAKPVYQVGLWPAGATATIPCQLEVTRIWYERNFTDVLLHYDVKNVGSITCTTTAYLTNQVTGDSLQTATVTTTYSTFWKNTSPTKAYWMAVSPNIGFCSLELTRQFYQQRLDGNGLHRDIGITVKNVGSNPCTGTVKWSVV
jgi:hypothetical protein